ncbi:hypothetical protein AK812_SmicGene3076 [Symbiodinium microadriaticum]|uniref:Protein kinase domain-containing protein n=1 Tax=Symbiodinium microadriaticum TaxID=2951 RepID=A0A1Q9EZZ0_SYMMI|nr:hypothetical protein AK812_SmicGene3076 [Symbiodinium microadriaticum]
MLAHRMVANIQLLLLMPIKLQLMLVMLLIWMGMVIWMALIILQLLRMILIISMDNAEWAHKAPDLARLWSSKEAADALCLGHLDSGYPNCCGRLMHDALDIWIGLAPARANCWSFSWRWSSKGRIDLTMLDADVTGVVANHRIHDFAAAMTSPSTISTRSDEGEDATNADLSLVTFRESFDLGEPLSEFIGSGSMSIVRRFELVKSLRREAQSEVSYDSRVLITTGKPEGLGRSEVEEVAYPVVVARPLTMGEVPMQWQLKITDFNSAKRVGKGNGQGPTGEHCSHWQKTDGTCLLLTDRGTPWTQHPNSLQFGDFERQAQQLFNAPELRKKTLSYLLRFNIHHSIMVSVKTGLKKRYANSDIWDDGSKLPQVDWSIMSPLAGNLIRQCLLVDPCDRPTAMELPAFASILWKVPHSETMLRSEESTSTNSSFTASRRIALENPTLDTRLKRLHYGSCGLVTIGDSRVGSVLGAEKSVFLLSREAPQVQRGSVWLEVEALATRRLNLGFLTKSPLFLGGRSFPTPPTPPAERHWAIGRIPSAIFPLGFSPGPGAPDGGQPYFVCAPPEPQQQSQDVLMRMANDKFYHIDDLIRQESEPANADFSVMGSFWIREVVPLPDVADFPDDEERPIVEQ